VWDSKAGWCLVTVWVLRLIGIWPKGMYIDSKK